MENKRNTPVNSIAEDGLLRNDFKKSNRTFLNKFLLEQLIKNGRPLTVGGNILLMRGETHPLAAVPDLYVSKIKDR